MEVKKVTFCDNLLRVAKDNAGLSPVKHPVLEEFGFLYLPRLCDISPLVSPPQDPGQLIFSNRGKIKELFPTKKNTFSRFMDPFYQELSFTIKRELQKILNAPLYETYHLDRFYYEGSDLPPHVDRSSCEISVSLHIGSTLGTLWPIWMKSPNKYRDRRKKELVSEGGVYSLTLRPGDAVLYKGCEVIHWRDPLTRVLEGDETFLYSHNVFFHYVLQNGRKAHFAWDQSDSDVEEYRKAAPRP